jgi:IclR family pca regulon transcriptional regulator
VGVRWNEASGTPTPPAKQYRPRNAVKHPMPKMIPPTFTVDEAGEWAQSVPILREPRYSQSLERGLAILNSFSPELPVLGIADIADSLGMSRSTTHRYVITLRELGYLEQVKERKYRLALPIISLGMEAMNSMGIREHSRYLLHELCQRTGYTTSLAVLDGLEILYCDRAPGARRGIRKVDLGLDIGSRLPIHATAMGKLLLAYLYDEAQRETITELTLTGQGPNTIRSKKALKTELEAIREVGIAVNDEELAPELISIAAPVRDSSREVVAAINLAANKAVITVEQLVNALAPHLVSSADRISARLGFRREDEPRSSLADMYHVVFQPA